MARITLRQWGDRFPVPPATETLRRWHRACMIHPPSEFDGYRILVEENAVKINPRTGRKIAAPDNSISLTARIKNGSTETKP